MAGNQCDCGNGNCKRQFAEGGANLHNDAGELYTQAGMQRMVWFRGTPASAEKERVKMLAMFRRCQTGALLVAATKRI